MKKIITYVLLLALCVSAFAGCSKPVEEKDPLAEARAYVLNTYKNASEVYIADYKVLGQVLVGDITYTVTWTTDAKEENVKIIPGDDGMVTIDINEKNPEEVTYTLTATITDADGKTVSVSFNRRTPAAIILEEGMSYEDIVNAAYKLEAGITMDGTFRLFGTITKIDTAYNPSYKNITVTIQVGDLADKPIMCYRLAGEGAENLKVGDKITAEGKIKNYNGTIEFDAGCTLDLVIKGEAETPEAPSDPKQIVDAAFNLEKDQSLPYVATLTGKITKIDTPYDENYKNITVTISVEGTTGAKDLLVYRLKGDGADKLAVGDTITVTGTIKNYNGTVEFLSGCTFVKAK